MDFLAIVGVFGSKCDECPGAAFPYKCYSLFKVFYWSFIRSSLITVHKPKNSSLNRSRETRYILQINEDDLATLTVTRRRAYSRTIIILSA